LALSYGRIAKIAAQFSHGPVNSAMGQTPCSTERISNLLVTFLTLSVSLQQTPHIIGNRVGEHDVDVRFLAGSRNKAVLRMRNKKYAIWPLLVAISPKFLYLIPNQRRKTRW